MGLDKPDRRKNIIGATLAAGIAAASPVAAEAQQRNSAPDSAGIEFQINEYAPTNPATGDEAREFVRKMDKVFDLLDVERSRIPSIRDVAKNIQNPDRAAIGYASFGMGISVRLQLIDRDLQRSLSSGDKAGAQKLYDSAMQAVEIIKTMPLPNGLAIQFQQQFNKIKNLMESRR